MRCLPSSHRVAIPARRGGFTLPSRRGPLLEGWLQFEARVRDGAVTPFTIPGHTHRTDLVSEVIRGDVPLFAGLDALIASIERHRGAPSGFTAPSAWTVEAESALDPRTAFFPPHETVPVASAPGRVCAELIAPYPPGVPVLAPGDVVTAAALDTLPETIADGGRIAYAADPTLATIQVVSR